MITFNTCRSWWGGCQINTVRDRALKPVYNFLNSSRYIYPYSRDPSYVPAAIYSQQYVGSISAVSRVRSLMSAGSFFRTAAGNRAPTVYSFQFRDR